MPIVEIHEGDLVRLNEHYLSQAPKYRREKYERRRFRVLYIWRKSYDGDFARADLVTVKSPDLKTPQRFWIGFLEVVQEFDK